MKRMRSGRPPYAEVNPELVRAVVKDARKRGMNRMILAATHKVHMSTIRKWEQRMPELRFRQSGEKRRRAGLFKSGKYKRTKENWTLFKRLYPKSSEKEVCQAIGISRPTYWTWSLRLRGHRARK